MLTGSEVTRLREARRLQRLRTASIASSSDGSETGPVQTSTQNVNQKLAKNRFLLDIAWRTVVLMQRNRLIQEKMLELQKETSEFVASVMSNPENQKRYVEHVQKLGHTNVKTVAFSQGQPIMPVPVILKLEPSS